MNNSIVAIVPASGIGHRASNEQNDIPKQYKKIAGIPILRHTVTKLLLDSRISHVNVIIKQDDCFAEQILDNLNKVNIIKCGGKRRIDTVYNAINLINLNKNDWIIIHDAVRPGFSINCLTKFIDQCLYDKVGGILAIPVIDTIKKGSIRVHHTINRDDLWLIQTPQMFRFGLLKKALSIAIQNNLPDITDEASAIEYIGHNPLIIKGSISNFKITWPEDFALMEKLYGF
ncbi:2-C-methyl-D-erythritol 4-phosphate cytidylyltransferase [Candidatus Kinetoplastibacterium sorsogonicusi]|uniref:2-C-methyl-D-erythritol 4-phosphate cytidylyltransferase n=1 Tax=Candidatus Kinetoplastidibacterium kentomonadis TaxID=1576550 RepID=A0A3S7JAA1_9PROT|nr:2-C-methyl-D-erythritol 4-phosphate cytidylyltransferase [Candidatus Kinetoplastibacterium sorsogonicusi]AWD32581.1 2-C-methyl-D-erythritol 4-phosphate cytidylyltransferase [Candidatus Kinetoplastibacterium sorsogonicusi]